MKKPQSWRVRKRQGPECGLEESGSVRELHGELSATGSRNAGSEHGLAGPDRRTYASGSKRPSAAVQPPSTKSTDPVM